MSAAHDGRHDGRIAGSFARIPAHVIYSGAALGSRRVLEAIVERSDYRTGLTNGDCSVRLLAAALSLSPGTVHEHVGRLVAAGLLIVHLPGRSHRPTRYRLPWLGGDDIHSARPDRAKMTPPEQQFARPHRAQRAATPREDGRLLLSIPLQNYPEARAPHPYPCSCDACLEWIERRHGH